MSNRDDVSKLYQPSQTLGTLCKALFWLNFIISLSNVFLRGTQLEIMSVIQIAMTLGYVFATVIDDGVFWFHAESERRKNSIQTAFGVRLSELETDEYYNNMVSPSAVKYCINNFESNYFSKFIASKMLVLSIIKSLLAIIILISASRMVADGSILLIITQTIFSAFIVEDTIYLTMYVNRLSSLYDSMYMMLVTTGIHSQQQVPVLLSYCVEYECIKSYYKIRLDSKIFQKYNHQLSNEWNQIAAKIEVHIPTDNARADSL